MTDQQPACERCRYISAEPYQWDGQYGHKCLRYPPIATGGMMSSAATIWPVVVIGRDWCGEFEENPDA